MNPSPQESPLKLTLEDLKNRVIHTRHSEASSIGYDGEWLLISMKAQHSNFPSLAEHTEAFWRSGTNGYTKISLSTIREIKFHSKFSELILRYQDGNSQKLSRHYLSIKEDEVRAEFCRALAQECKLQTEHSRENPFARIWANLIFTLITAVLTYVAVSIAKGQFISHRRASVQLAGEILRLLGPTTSMAIGAVIGTFFLYRIIRNYFSPTHTYTFTT